MCAGCRDSIAIQVERYAGAAHLLASAAWQLVGGAQLALVHSLTVLEAYHDCAPADDQCLALAQLAAANAAAHGYRWALCSSGSACLLWATTRLLAYLLHSHRCLLFGGNGQPKCHASRHSAAGDPCPCQLQLGFFWPAKMLEGLQEC